jgi:hypothetical protein
MTKEAIEKLPQKCKCYCETMKALIVQDIEKGNHEQQLLDYNELRGYLSCLKDMGILDEYEMRSVRAFYSENWEI